MLSRKRKEELERLLRAARQRVFDEPRYERIIVRCKRALLPTWDARNQGSRERWAQTMWI